jgi:hypothetical protein
MSRKLNIIQGTTPSYYHVLPSDLARVTVSPQRDAIFHCLSRIGSDYFVDFVIDLLVIVTGHTLVERTDGPGDEKQDILTLDRSGHRHLTQCKHTINSGDKTSGDELDVLFGACHRKNCRTGLYVTNADLTPQAMRYVTDKEYTRLGAVDPRSPTIDYWNGRRIWDQVSKSNAILNKWFSGMAQAHALRRFFFDAVITGMPSGEPCTLSAQELARALERTYDVAPAQNASFDVTIDATLTLNLSDWFRAFGDLGVRFLRPDDGTWHPAFPLRTVRIQALLSENVGAYDITEYRTRIARTIATALSDTAQPEWWHMLVTAPQAFVFLQDVAKAALVDIDGPDAFVRLGAEPLSLEREWAFRPGSDFARLPSSDDPDDVAWIHSTTGSTLRLLVDEAIHPMVAYDLQLRQAAILQQLRTHSFRAVENADATVIETVRRLTDPRWFVLQSSHRELFWTYPPDADAEIVARLEGVLQRRGVEVLIVRDEDRDTLLKAVESSPPESGGAMLVTGEHASCTPVALHRRTFWFSRDSELASRPSLEQLLNLVKFKLTHESKHGFDAFGGKREETLAGEEIRRLLFDPISFRGRRMIDVGFSNRKLSIHLRVRDRVIASAAQLATDYAAEFAAVCDEVLRCLVNPA